MRVVVVGSSVNLDFECQSDVGVPLTHDKPLELEARMPNYEADERASVMDSGFFNASRLLGRRLASRPDAGQPQEHVPILHSDFDNTADYGVAHGLNDAGPSEAFVVREVTDRRPYFAANEFANVTFIPSAATVAFPDVASRSARKPEIYKHSVGLSAALVVLGGQTNSLHAVQAARGKVPIVAIPSFDGVGAGVFRRLVADPDLDLVTRRHLAQLRASWSEDTPNVVISLLEHLVQVGRAASPPDVFISYARAAEFGEDDRYSGLASIVYRQLWKDAPVAWPWLDHVGLQFGDELEPTIMAAIGSSKVFVPVITPDWYQSRWCQAELTRAQQSGCRILPLVAEGAPPPEIPFSVVVTADSLMEAVEALVGAVLGAVASSTDEARRS